MKKEPLDRYDQIAKQFIVLPSLIIPILKAFVKELSPYSDKEIKKMYDDGQNLASTFHISINKKEMTGLIVDILYGLTTPRNEELLFHFEIQDQYLLNKIMVRNFEYSSAIYFEKMYKKLKDKINHKIKLYNFWVVTEATKDLEGKILNVSPAFMNENINTSSYHPLIESYIIGLFNCHKDRKKEILACDDQCFTGLSIIFSDLMKRNEKDATLKLKGFNMTQKESEALSSMTDYMNSMINRTREDVTKEVTEKVTKEVTEKVTKSVTEKVTKAVTEKVTEEVTKAVTESVSEKLTKNTFEITRLIKSGKSVDEIKALHPEFDKNYIREFRNLILTN